MEAISAEYSPRRPLPLAALRNHYGHRAAQLSWLAALWTPAPLLFWKPSAMPQKLHGFREPGPPGDASPCPDEAKPHRSPWPGAPCFGGTLAILMPESADGISRSDFPLAKNIRAPLRPPGSSLLCPLAFQLTRPAKVAAFR